jgi:hypothetical protein
VEFEFCCNVDSLEAARSGAIWGGILIEIYGEPFPEVDWNDMPVAFLVEFLAAVRSVQDSTGINRRVRFFDGPFVRRLESLCR